MADEMDKIEGDLTESPAEAADGKKAPAGDGKKGAPGADPKGKKDKRNTAVLIVLTAAGVLVAWLTFKKSGTSTAPASGSSALNPAQYPAGAGSAGSAAGYAGDVSGGYSNYLSTLQAEISQLSAGSVPQTGVSTSPYSPYSGSGFDLADAGKLKWIRDRATGAIYEILPNGSQYHVSPQEWAAAQAVDPNITYTQFGVAPPARPTVTYAPHPAPGPAPSPGGVIRPKS